MNMDEMNEIVEDIQKQLSEQPNIFAALVKASTNFPNPGIPLGKPIISTTEADQGENMIDSNGVITPDHNTDSNLNSAANDAKYAMRKDLENLVAIEPKVAVIEPRVGTPVFASIDKPEAALTGGLRNFIDETKKKIEGGKKEKQDNDLLASMKFGNDIKILLICAVDWRIICHFIGVQSVTDVKNAPVSAVPMIGLLYMECLKDFMKAKGYGFAGEIDFDERGNPVPVKKHTWILKEKEFSFTRQGYMFFEAQSGNKNDNLVFYVFSDLSHGVSGITAYSTDTGRSKRIVNELEQYTKQHNCVRGAKLRDINMMNAEFEEVTSIEKYTWGNYYYEDYVKDCFDLEVFGFLNNTEKFNKKGITKRGILMHGEPGCGKTTIGRIICNLAGDKTVIWITPDLIAENNAGKHSIKLLYQLADFVSPTVLILEDIDLWANDRDDMGDTLRLGALMNILDGVNSVKNAVTVAMTNRIELIEKALRNRPGRFDRLVNVNYMIDSLKRKMLTDRTAEFKIDDGVLDYVINQTNKATGADIQEFINSVNMYFVHNDLENKQHLTMEVAKKVLKTIGKFSMKGEEKKKRVGFNSYDEED